MESRITIGLTKREAETYRSHGLFQESLDLYEQLLDETFGIEEGVKNSIKSKIAELKSELERIERDQSRDISEADLQLIRKNFGDQGGIEEILTQATAFHETGVYKEAIREYQKLMGRACPPEKYAAALADCLLAEYSEATFFAQLNQILRESPIKGLERALLLFRCGEELEGRDYTEIALKLYKAAFQTLLGKLIEARRIKSRTSEQKPG